MDSRSLRLNFEFSIEIYDRSFAEGVFAHIDQVRGRSREVTIEEVDSRPLPEKARDSFAWLFSPYL